MTRQEWLRTHAFLDPIASLHDRVDGALAAIRGPLVALPSWDDHAADYHEGVPLLRGAGAAVDLAPAGGTTIELIDALAAGPESDRIAAEARALAAALRGVAAPAQRVADFLLGDDSFQPSSAGLLRFLGWQTTRRFLEPLLNGFAKWRDQDRWQRSECPTCGWWPAMAQLVGVDPGRMRFLCCGCCGTRWRYRRTACPFCVGDTHRVQVLDVEGEGGLRIDHCETCRGYLKTYVGQGNEDVMLADWTSLHLDVLAQDRGLERRAASLYGLEGDQVAST